MVTEVWGEALRNLILNTSIYTDKADPFGPSFQKEFSGASHPELRKKTTLVTSLCDYGS